GAAGDRHRRPGPPRLPGRPGLAVRHDAPGRPGRAGRRRPGAVGPGPAPIPVTWAELAEARAGVAPARHRLVVAELPPGAVDLAGAAAAGIADTWRGMLDPPMRNFGVPGLAKWAELLTAPRAPKGWPRLLDAPGRQVQLLTWLYDWVETAGTGGGFFRAMYAEFLEAAAGPLGRPGAARVVRGHPRLA